jgi:hypothetical protein
VNDHRWTIEAACVFRTCTVCIPRKCKERKACSALGLAPCIDQIHAGITTQDVEDMEERLRQDVLTEAAQYDQQILVSDEDDSFNVFDKMLQVSEQDVQTPKAMFEELRSDGYNVQYSRIPITDEKVCGTSSCPTGETPAWHNSTQYTHSANRWHFGQSHRASAQ